MSVPQPFAPPPGVNVPQTLTSPAPAWSPTGQPATDPMPGTVAPLAVAAPQRSVPKLVVGIIMTVIGGLATLGVLVSATNGTTARRIPYGVDPVRDATRTFLNLLVIAILLVGIVLIATSQRKR